MTGAYASQEQQKLTYSVHENDNTAAGQSLLPSPRGISKLRPTSSPSSDAKPKAPSVALTALHWSGHGEISALHSLGHWQSIGLLDAVDEKILYINSRDMSGNDPVEKKALELGFRVIGNASNGGIGYAYASVVAATRETTQFVLFLEKDWIPKPEFHNNSARFMSIWRRLLSVMAEQAIEKVHLRRGQEYHELYSHGNLSVPCFGGYDGEWAPTYCQNHHDVGGPPLWERLPTRYSLCYQDPPEEMADGHGLELVCYSRAGPWTNNPLLFTRDWFMHWIHPHALRIGGFNTLEEELTCGNQPCSIPEANRTAMKAKMATFPAGLFVHCERGGGGGEEQQCKWRRRR